MLIKQTQLFPDGQKLLERALILQCFWPALPAAVRQRNEGAGSWKLACWGPHCGEGQGQDLPPGNHQEQSFSIMERNCRPVLQFAVPIYTPPAAQEGSQEVTSLEALGIGKPSCLNHFGGV